MELVILKSGLFEEFIRYGKGVSHANRLKNSLVQLGIIQSSQKIVYYEDIEPWHKGGSETYIAECKIKFKEGNELHIIAKALISLATESDRLTKTWLNRRDILKNYGIRVPKLFATNEGVLFEEFIDNKFELENLKSKNIINEVGKYAAILDFHGFITLSFLSDLRIKNNKLYFVDFGFDLGEPSHKIVNNAKQEMDKKIQTRFKSLIQMNYKSHLKLLTNLQ